MSLRLSGAVLQLVLSSVIIGCGSGQPDTPPPVPEPRLVKLLAAIDGNELSAVNEQLTVLKVNPNALVGWRTPLVAAVGQWRGGHTKLVCNREIVAMLLNHGADPNGIDQRIGITPLHYALSLGEIECAKLLRKAGATIESPIPGRKSVLAEAVNGAGHTHDMSPIDLVLSWGVDPNRSSGLRKWTALFEASWLGNADVIRYLVTHGADPCYRDFKGKTALDMVSKQRDPGGEARKALAEAMKGRCE